MANEKRLIDANDLWVDIMMLPHNGDMISSEEVEQAIKDTPTVEEAHGYWIERPLDNFRKYEVKCSECGFVGIGNYDQYLEPYDFNYCPNCGAKMDGDGNG